MQIEFINIGHGNIVAANRVVAIVSIESAPIKRYVDQAEELGKLVTAVKGRKWRSAIITDSNHVVLSSLHPETIANRIYSERQTVMEESEEVEKEGKTRAAKKEKPIE